MNPMKTQLVRAMTLVMTALAAFACLPRPALAQNSGDVRVTAQLSAPRVYVNDVVDLTVTVEGSNAPDRPMLRVPDGIDAEFVGGSDTSSRFTSIINGQRQERVSQGYVFQYRLTPSREGTFTIPGPEVMVNGKVHSAAPLRFSAVRPDPSDEFFLRMQVDRDDLYVGEPARLRIVWGLATSVSNVSFSRMPGQADFDLATPRDRVPTGQRGSDDRTAEVNMFGRNVVGVWGEETVNGKTMRTLTFDLIVVPKDAGRHELGPVSITFDVGARQRSPFDIFEDRSNVRRASSMSNPVNINVKPLPEKGRPADFGGLVGTFSIKSMAEPRIVSVGDPITLKLLVDGPDPTDRVIAPDLSTVPGFGAFKLSSEGWHTDSGDLVGPRAFSTTIRVSDAKVTEIPPIELASFDPREGVYKRIRSAPLPLTVRATREVTAADAVSAGAALPVPITPASSLDSAGPGLVANAEGAWVLADEGGGLMDMVRSPVIAGALIAPPLAFFAATLVRIGRQRGEHESVKIARARREALKALGEGTPDAPTIGAALRGYAGAVLHIEPAAVTPVDCDSPGDPALAEIGRVLAACDAGRFGGDFGDLSTVAARARQVLSGRTTEGAAA